MEGVDSLVALPPLPPLPSNTKPPLPPLPSNIRAVAKVERKRKPRAVTKRPAARQEIDGG